MGLLTRDQILGANDLPFEDVPVPEWGDGAVVRVRALMASERDAWEASLLQKTKTGLALLNSLVILVCVDENGAPLFSDADAAALSRKSGVALLRVGTAWGGASLVFTAGAASSAGSVVYLGFAIDTDYGIGERIGEVFPFTVGGTTPSFSVAASMGRL